MRGPDARAWIVELAAVFERERERLGRLDAAVGDGDHGASMARGFAQAKEAVADLEDTPGGLLASAGRAFMKGVGGASGPLFATLLLELGKSAGGGDALDVAAVAHGTRSALARIQRLGRASLGEKTMVDALAPAADALDAAVAGELDLPDALASAADAAAAGADATTEMPARQGRARFIEGQGVGQPDPGATSMALVFRALSDAATRSDP